MSSHLPLDPLDATACGLPTSLADPLAAMGGVWRPPQYGERHIPVRSASLLGVDPHGGAMWFDLTAHGLDGEPVPVVGLAAAWPSRIVAALPTDAGGLLFLDSPSSRAGGGAKWVELGVSGTLTRTVPLFADTMDAGSRRASHAVRYGSLLYVLLHTSASDAGVNGGADGTVAKSSLGVYDASSLRLLRTLPLPRNDETGAQVMITRTVLGLTRRFGRDGFYLVKKPTISGLGNSEGRVSARYNGYTNNTCN